MSTNNKVNNTDSTDKIARVTKVGTVVAMLRRTEGATAAQLMEATGWQAHSVRGVIAGQIKKTLKFPVVTEKSEGGTVYRIAEASV